MTSAPSFVCDFCFCFHFLHRSPARFGSKFVILWVNASGVPGNALLSGRLCSKSHLIPMRSPRARQWVGVREYRVYVFTCLRVYAVLHRPWTLSPAWRSHLLPAWPGGEGETRGGADTGTKPVAPDSASPLGIQDGLGISMETARASLHAAQCT